MNKQKIKNIELNIAIFLAIVLLITIAVIFSKGNKKKIETIKASEVKKEQTVLKPRPVRPAIEEIKDDYIEKQEVVAGEAVAGKVVAGKVVEEEKEKPYEEIMLLKDLPLDLTAEEQKALKETEETQERKTSLNIQPSYEEMKAIQQKNLVLY